MDGDIPDEYYFLEYVDYNGAIIVLDGTYADAKNKKAVVENNIELVTASLTGKMLWAFLKV